MSAHETRMLILGAVALFEPVNGYQIRRELLSWQVDRWAKTNPGSIYHGLTSLTNLGHLVRHDLVDGGREVAVYELTPAGLRHVLQASIDSQAGLSGSARLRLRYEALLLRRALRSDNAGWKRYPVQIEALLENGHLKLVLGFGVEYSSTCPCSAALSRQANAERFAEDFAGAHPISTGVVRDWLASERGMAATPHAQRSEAKVKVELRPQFDELPLVALVDALEASLGTPVQTAVKREDEQAFAMLNAANLMFCEDAARRVASVLSADPRIERYEATVSHFESLHPHDAVASVSGRGPAA